MFDFSISKLAVLGLLALLFLGRKNCPRLPRKWVAGWAAPGSWARNLRSQLEQEISYDELLKEKQKAEAALKAAQQETASVHTVQPSTVQPSAVAPTTPPVSAVSTPGQQPARPTHPAITRIRDRLHE